MWITESANFLPLSKKVFTIWIHQLLPNSSFYTRKTFSSVLLSFFGRKSWDFDKTTVQCFWFPGIQQWQVWRNYNRVFALPLEYKDNCPMFWSGGSIGYQLDRLNVRPAKFMTGPPKSKVSYLSSQPRQQNNTTSTL